MLTKLDPALTLQLSDATAQEDVPCQMQLACEDESPPVDQLHS